MLLQKKVRDGSELDQDQVRVRAGLVGERGIGGRFFCFAPSIISKSQPHHLFTLHCLSTTRHVFMATGFEGLAHPH